MEGKQIGSVTPGGMGLMGDARKFSELTNEEKIDRLVMEMKMQRYLVDRIVRLEAVVLQLKNHRHVDGNVTIDIEDIDNSLRGDNTCRMDPFA